MLSRPIRKTATDLSGTTVTVLNRSTTVAAISITPKIDDLVVNFRNGNTQEILWTLEADASSGSASVCFGQYPIWFSQGIIAEVNKPDSLEAICVAVVEPKASGS